jgi:hypothetical protein
MLTTTAAVGLLLAAGLALDRHQFSYTGVQKPMPSNAVRYLSTHHDTGRVLAFSDWGGYLMGYGYMSFVDGRVDLFTGPLLNAANTLAVTRNYNPDALLNHYRVSYVIWPDQLALTSDLIHDPHWTRVQDVGYISLFVRTSPNPYANVSGLISKGA